MGHHQVLCAGFPYPECSLSGYTTFLLALRTGAYCSPNLISVHGTQSNILNTPTANSVLLMNSKKDLAFFQVCRMLLQNAHHWPRLRIFIKSDFSFLSPWTWPFFFITWLPWEFSNKIWLFPPNFHVKSLSIPVKSVFPSRRPTCIFKVCLFVSDLKSTASGIRHWTPEPGKWGWVGS